MWTLGHLVTFADNLAVIWYLASAIAWCWWRILGGAWKEESWLAFLIFLHRELWPLVPPALVVDIGFRTYSGIAGRVSFIVFGAVVLVQWWETRNWPDDENVWRRRGRRLKEKISALGGKLVVGSETT